MYGVPLSYISWSTVWYVLGGSLCPGKKVESRRRIVRIVHANRHAFWCLWRYRKASHIWFWSWEVIGIFLCKKHELNINISKWWPWLVKSLKFPNSPVPVPSRSQVQNRTQATVVSWHAGNQNSLQVVHLCYKNMGRSMKHFEPISTQPPFCKSCTAGGTNEAM